MRDGFFIFPLNPKQKELLQPVQQLLAIFIK